MSYAVALGLDQAIVSRLKEIGPSCYSADFSDCRDGDNPGYPHCDELRHIDDEHDAEWDAWIEGVPFCPGCYEGASTGWGRALVAGLAGIVIGWSLFAS